MGKISVATEIGRILAENRPHFESNIDAILYDYDFYRGFESALNKLSDSAKGAVLSLAANVEAEPYYDARGVQKSGATTKSVVGGRVSAKILETYQNRFDVEVFIDNIVDHYGDAVSRHKLRELKEMSTKKIGMTKITIESDL